MRNETVQVIMQTLNERSERKKRHSGTQFDPIITEAFMSRFDYDKNIN